MKQQNFISAFRGFMFFLCIMLTSCDSGNNKIKFKDSLVNALCVQKFDRDDDSHLNESEAAVVTELGGVFSGNKDITSFKEFAKFKGMRRLDNRDFEGCSFITEISLPENLVSIGENSFLGCSKLQEIKFPKTLEHIGTRAFAGSGLTSVTIPANTTTISYGIFSYCTHLCYIGVESGNTLLCSVSGTLYDCDTVNLIAYPCAMDTIDIPQKVRTIVEEAFAGAKNLSAIKFPESVETIENRAFDGCQSLKEIVLPANISDIGQKAFANCSLLEKVTIQATTPPTVRGNSFDGDYPIYIPESSFGSYMDDATWRYYYSERLRCF